jgi:hypothetical protein
MRRKSGHLKRLRIKETVYFRIHISTWHGLEGRSKGEIVQSSLRTFRLRLRSSATNRAQAAQGRRVTGLQTDEVSLIELHFWSILHDDDSGPDS